MISLHRSGLTCLALVLMLAHAPVAAQRGKQAADATPKQKQADGETPTALGSGGGLIVGGIQVDVGGKSAADARLNGWREAQRKAWPALWARMSGLGPDTAPSLPDSALDSMVSAIEVEREQISSDRYVARLAVAFDRVRASSYLGRYANLISSPPFLVLPVLQDAGARYAHEPQSPWLQAWSRLRAGETPIDYVRIQPAPGDVILLNSWQANRRHLFLWRALIDRYQVADVLIPELILERTYVGGPLSALLIVRFGTSGREIGRVRLSHPTGDVGALSDLAVREADKLYVAALRAGNLLPDPSLIEPDVPLTQLEDSGPEIGGGFAGVETTGLQVRVATVDDAALQVIQRTIAGTPGVEGVRLQSLVLGGESVLEIVSSVPFAELRYALDMRGLRLDGNVIRPRTAADAPLPRPITSGEAQLEEVTAGQPKSLLPETPK